MTVLTDFALTVPGTDLPVRAEAGRLVALNHSFARLDNGIWDLIRSDRSKTLDEFAADYAAVRAAEQRELSPSEVRALPRIRADHPLAEMWAERAASHHRFEVAIASLVPGTVVDIGAGCGWLAARLAANGWRAAALDITVAGGDGLGAAVHHDQDLLLVRAEMEAMPFASGTVDLAVFNASLHYAADVAAAIGEAGRVLRPGGTLAVFDSPVYSDASAGHAMVAEFAVHVEHAHGLRAATNEGNGYLLEAEVAACGFERVEATTGLRRRFNQWRGAKLAGRETASRPLLIAKVGST